jgi:hypothetical protein
MPYAGWRYVTKSISTAIKAGIITEHDHALMRELVVGKLSSLFHCMQWKS